MATSTLISIAIAAAIASLGVVLLARAFVVWRRFHGARVVTCPETGHPAAVHIDLWRAMTGASAPRPAAEKTGRVNAQHLRDCSRWLERGRCDESCIAEARAPESSARSIAERWFASKQCVFCRKPIVAQFLDHHAALLTTGGVTIEWNELPPEQLSQALHTYLPVCWDCHIAETFRRKYPDLVTDR